MNKVVNLEQVEVTINGVRLHSITIPDGYVSPAFNAHIDNHILVSSDELHEGMVVILAESKYRADPSDLEPGKNVSSYTRQNIQRSSRWAIVTRLAERASYFEFDGLYGDGTVIPRSASRDTRWIVLKETEFAYYCDFCGLVHDTNENVTARVKDVVTEPTTQVFTFNVSNPAEINVEDIARITSEALSRAEESAVRDFVSYSEADVAATQKLFEAQKDLIDNLPRPKPVWVEQIPITEIEKDDWLPMGGDFYRVIDVQLPTEHGNVILWVKSLNKDPDQNLSTFVLAPSVLVNVKRRVQRLTK